MAAGEAAPSLNNPDKHDKRTTLPPEEVLEEKTTTPPFDDSTTSILQSMIDTVNQTLHSDDQQTVVALIALVFGLLLVWSGEHAIGCIVVALIFLLAMALAMSDVSAVWGLGSDSSIRSIVGVEAGLVAAYCAYHGLEGTVLALGVAFGVFIAYGMQAQLVAWGVSQLATDKPSIVGFYSLVTVLTLIIIRRRKYKRGLVILSCAVGASLIASVLAWATTEGYLAGKLVSLKGAIPEGATPKGGAWIDFWTKMFLSCDPAVDYGLFAGKNFDLYWTICLDRIVDGILWFVLFYFTARRQWCNLVHAREGGTMHEPLLPK